MKHVVGILLSVLLLLPAAAQAELEGNIYNPGRLPPTDSTLKVQPGDAMPDFSLPAVQGSTVSLADFLGKKNMVLSFVPAAWTPVCSGQWPGYNILQPEFEARDAVLLGVSVDNVPTLHAWINEMGGLWFPVLSDFWPHGGLAQALGILRSDGTSERALFVVNKQGIITYIDVHDINTRPELGALMQELDKLAQ